MLNITRKPGEAVKLSGVLSPGQQVLISVNEIRGQSVKVGIAAPPGVVINRADAARGSAAKPVVVVPWDGVLDALTRATDEMMCRRRTGTGDERDLIRETLVEVRDQLRREVTT